MKGVLIGATTGSKENHLHAAVTERGSSGVKCSRTPMHHQDQPDAINKDGISLSQPRMGVRHA